MWAPSRSEAVGGERRPQKTTPPDRTNTRGSSAYPKIPAMGPLSEAAFKAALTSSQTDDGHVGGGHDVRGTGTGTTQVGVTSVGDHLVSDVEVGGRHGPVLDSEGVAQDLAHGGNTVGGARGVGHHVLGGGVVVALVDSAHVGGAVLAGGGDDNLLRTSLQVLGGSLQGVEGTGSFDDHLDAHVAPAVGSRWRAA